MFSIKGKNILVTGGAGFVGGHLVEELLKLKANVIVVDINYNKNSYLSSLSLYKNLKPAKLIKLDICDFKKLNKLIKKYKIEFIFHLAAQALVEEAYKKPKYTLDNNILSTINVLEAVRINPQIKGIIVASSDKAYGKLNYTDSVMVGRSNTESVKQRKLSYKETYPLAGDHPYDTSKSVTDLISTTYYKTYKIPVVVTRFGNIYGEGDLNFSRIIPGIMKSLVKSPASAKASAGKEKFEIRSNGKYVRDYLYVKDVVNGYILLAENIEKVKGEAFNFGSHETLSVLQLINLLEQTLSKKIKYKILNIAHNEIPYQSLDYSKIKKTLGWKPKESIKSTMKKIFSWYFKSIK